MGSNSGSPACSIYSHCSVQSKIVTLKPHAWQRQIQITLPCNPGSLSAPQIPRSSVTSPHASTHLWVGLTQVMQERLSQLQFHLHGCMVINMLRSQDPSPPAPCQHIISPDHLVQSPMQALTLLGWAHVVKHSRSKAPIPPAWDPTQAGSMGSNSGSPAVLHAAHIHIAQFSQRLSP